MPGPCPTTERLAAALRSELRVTEQTQLEEHLAECIACQSQLEQLAAGGLSSAPRPKAVPPSSRLDQVVRKLCASGGAENAAGADDSPLSPAGGAQHFGDYEILEELGRGGMGVVYRAQQLSLNRPVALKLILAGQLASPSEVRRFRNEAEAAARLDHPNIVPIYEIGEHEGRHYFSMKLVEGRPLSERISDLRSQVSNGAATRLVANIARTVHYAHGRGVLHRDLKPNNVLIDVEGRPHLTDFGLAKLLEADSSLTFSSIAMGTPNYMAPEVAEGHSREATTATDIYSLGTILFEALTGRPPFLEGTVAATLQKVATAEAPAPSRFNPAISRDLDTITLKCLEKRPGRRYVSALELAEDLERFTRGEPIAARPVPRTERVWRWCQRQPALAVTLATLCVVLALGIAGMLWQWRRAEGAKAQLAEARGPLENRPPASSTASFAVGNNSGVFARAFPDLNQAIQAAELGAVIECRFTGDWPIEAIDLGTKPLIIRAVANSKPAFVITRRPAPLLRTRAPLVLEGLTFKVPALESRPSQSLYRSPFNEPVIESSNAPLWMANCRIELVGSLGGPLAGGCCVGLLDNSFAAFENCEFYAPVNGAIGHLHTAISAGGTASERDRIVVRNCVQTGFALVHPKDLRDHPMLIELTRNSTAIGSCAIGFTEPPINNQVTVAATQNVFAVDYVVGSQPPARTEPALRLLRWIDATNVIQVKEGFTRTGPPLTTVEQWESFVGSPGGVWIQVELALSSRIMKLRTDMNQFTPERFLLSTAEKEQLERISPGLSQTLGVQPEICGPGEPYDRWKRSPAYLRRSKEIERLFFQRR